MILLVLISWYAFGVLASPIHFAGNDDCDWTGSGLDQGKGVRPVYLRCSEGIVEWQYPRGALRVLLRFGTSGKDFQGCLRVDSNSTTSATIYVEGHRSLQQIFSPNDAVNHPQLQRCFTSTHGQVALFVEANAVDPSSFASKTHLRFHYELTDKRTSECRPCTEEEMIYLYCTSDFVVRGTISALYHNSALQRTELLIRAHQVIRDAEPPVFISDPIDEKSSEDNIKFGELHRPLKCGTKAGRGEFLFMGRRSLGNAVLTCAPRWTEWKRVRRKALRTETACVLQ